MRTFDTTNHDINFRVADKLESVKQRIDQRLLFFQGEHFADNTLGVPYIQEIFTHAPNLTQVEQIITQQIRSVVGVVDVQNAITRLDNKTRILNYTAEIATDFGDIRFSFSPQTERAITAQQSERVDFWTAGGVNNYWSAEILSPNHHLWHA